PGLEVLLELGVVERRARQGPTDVLGHVVVAEADGVGVAVGALPYLAAVPAADTGDRAQAAIGLLVAELGRPLQAVRDLGDGDDRARPGRVDLHPQPLPRRDPAERLRGGLEPPPQHPARAAPS